MCQRDDETVDHLLLHCPAIQPLWSFVFRAFNIYWVLPRRVMDLLFGWRNCLGRHQSNIWNLAPLCLMWTVWRERNSRTFEDVKKSADQLRGSFVESLFDWSRAGGFTTANTVHDFVAVLHSDFSHISLL
jgi:DNA segregation ATPase FtsK/SpoIIIE-like protein